MCKCSLLSTLVVTTFIEAVYELTGQSKLSSSFNTYHASGSVACSSDGKSSSDYDLQPTSDYRQFPQ